jgi:hypothetical protein
VASRLRRAVTKAAQDVRVPASQPPGVVRSEVIAPTADAQRGQTGRDRNASRCPAQLSRRSWDTPQINNHNASGDLLAKVGQQHWSKRVSLCPPTGEGRAWDSASSPGQAAARDESVWEAKSNPGSRNSRGCFTFRVPRSYPVVRGAAAIGTAGAAAGVTAGALTGAAAGRAALGVTGATGCTGGVTGAAWHRSPAWFGMPGRSSPPAPRNLDPV